MGEEDDEHPDESLNSGEAGIHDGIHQHPDPKDGGEQGEQPENYDE